MDMKKMNSNREWKEKAFLLAVADLITITGSYFFALLLRFDFTFSAIESKYVGGFLNSILLWSAVTIVVFYFCRLYHTIWSLASVTEILAIIKAYLILIPIYLLIIAFWEIDMPRSYYVMGYVINFCLTAGMRFSYRLLRLQYHGPHRDAKREDRIMIIGAGAAGQMLIKEMRSSPKLNTKVCCVIDDNPNKKGRFIEGIEIVGNRHDIVNMAEKYHITTIIYSIPSNDPADRKAILNLCKETKCRLRTIPGMYQLVNDEVSVSRVRDVELADLLGREQIQVNNDEIFADIEGKVILVTGGSRGVTSKCLLALMEKAPCKVAILGRAAIAEEHMDDAETAKIPDLREMKTLIARRYKAEGYKGPFSTIEKKAKAILDQRDMLNTFSTLEKIGCTVRYYACNVNNRADLAKTMEQIRQELGQVRGIIHGAGLLADCKIWNKDMTRFRAVLDTKYAGLNNILSCVDNDQLKLVVSFSSVAGYFGNDGQMDYAAGNEFLAKFSHHFRRKHPSCKALTINWGAWDGGMMDYIYRKTLTEKGYVLIPLEVGANYFANEFLNGLPSGQILISNNDKPVDLTRPAE